MLTGFIYVITNDINGKQYVGKTRDSIKNRFVIHLKDYTKKYEEKRPLYEAMNKYGIEHFSIKEIEKCPIDVLEEREQFWINKLNTFHNGYNATLGGDGKLLYDYDIFVEEYKNGLTVSEIMKKYGCCYDTVLLAIHKAGLDSSINARNKKPTVSIIQIDLNNNIIQIFNSVSDAARWLIDNNKTQCLKEKGIVGHILDVARNKRRTAYGYKWQFVDNKDNEIKFNKSKKVICIETQQVFNSSADAAKWCNLKNKTGIRDVCNKRQKTAGKHPITGEKLHWEFFEE